MYNAANSQQSNTYQYPTDKKGRKLFEVPTCVCVCVCVCIYIYIYIYIYRGTAVAQWLRCCATNRKVAGSITAGVIGIFP